MCATSIGSTSPPRAPLSGRAEVRDAAGYRDPRVPVSATVQRDSRMRSARSSAAAMVAGGGLEDIKTVSVSERPPPAAAAHVSQSFALPLGRPLLQGTRRCPPCRPRRGTRSRSPAFRPRGLRPVVLFETADSLDGERRLSGELLRPGHRRVEQLLVRDERIGETPVRSLGASTASPVRFHFEGLRRPAPASAASACLRSRG